MPTSPQHRRFQASPQQCWCRSHVKYSVLSHHQSHVSLSLSHTTASGSQANPPPEMDRSPPIRQTSMPVMTGKCRCFYLRQIAISRPNRAGARHIVFIRNMGNNPLSRNRLIWFRGWSKKEFVYLFHRFLPKIIHRFSLLQGLRYLISRCPKRS